MTTRKFRDRTVPVKKIEPRRRGDEPETVDEFLARGGVIEVLPPFAMSGHEVDDDEDE